MKETIVSVWLTWAIHRQPLLNARDGLSNTRLPRLQEGLMLLAQGQLFASFHTWLLICDHTTCLSLVSQPVVCPVIMRVGYTFALLVPTKQTPCDVFSTLNIQTKQDKRQSRIEKVQHSVIEVLKDYWVHFIICCSIVLVFSVFLVWIANYSQRVHGNG